MRSETIASLLALTLANVAAAAAPRPADLVARGEHLASTGDCMTFRSADGAEPFAGGRYIDTPFGAIAASDITVDKATGIGIWTDAQFSLARRLGHFSQLVCAQLHSNPAMTRAR